MNIFTLSNRSSARIFSAMALLSLLASLIPMQVFAQQSDNTGKPEEVQDSAKVRTDINPEVTICHANSGAKFFTAPTVDANSIVNLPNGHDDHDTNGLDNKGDIIPSFEYDFGTGLTVYPGKNLTTVYSNGLTGEQIYNNGKCNGGAGTITIQKTVDGGSAKAKDFTFKIDGEEVDVNEKITVFPGAHTVTEDMYENYTPSVWSGACAADGSITTVANTDSVCTITNTYVPPAEKTATFVAHKIECTDEADLPNWGNGGPNITSATASDWAAAHDSCKLASGWDFEWALDSNVTDPGDTLVGPAGGSWTTFGSTNASGVTSISLTTAQLSGNTKVWFREVLKPDYLTFSHDQNLNNSNPVTAEFYCHNDALNYDNYDNITGVAVDNTYHCVAWNVPLVVPGCTDDAATNYNPDATVDDGSCEYQPVACTVEIVSNTSDYVVEKSAFAKVLSVINTGWTAVIPSASWIWGDNPVVNPIADEPQTFVKQFGFVGNVTNATLYVASDNSNVVTLNGDAAGAAPQEDNFKLATQDQYNVTSLIEQGNNKLVTLVVNKGIVGSTPASNPAGLLYKLVIEGTTTTDADCAVPYEPPYIPQPETITACKFNAETEAAISGWDMTVSNGKDTVQLTTGETGCVSTIVDAKMGPWTVTEAMETGWTFDSVAATGGLISGKSCQFFTPVQQDARIALSDSYKCDFYNTEDEIIVPVPVCLTNENLLTNGSFEEPLVANGGYGIFNTVTGWTVSLSDGLEIWNNLFGGGSAGPQNAELDGDDATRISQPVATVAGATYKLSFDFSPRPQTDLAQNSIDALVNGGLLLNVSGDGSLLQTNTWAPYYKTFVAAGTSTEIAFEDKGIADAEGGVGSLLDNAVLCLVELPEDEDDGDGDSDKLTCEISADDLTISRGGDVTLNWSAVGATSASITGLDGEITLPGSRLIEDIDEDTTYTMTVYGDYNENTEEREQATCSVAIDTRSGGGGGGGGGTRIGDRNPTGTVLGESTSVAPTPLVLGEQVSVVPTGAPDAGAGGSTSKTVSFFTVTSLAIVRRSQKNG